MPDGPGRPESGNARRKSVGLGVRYQSSARRTQYSTRAIASQARSGAAASSCQDLWTFLPEGCGSGRGIASVEFDTEEFTDGHDLAATAAFATDADVSAPKAAGATPSLPEKAFLAG